MGVSRIMLGCELSEDQNSALVKGRVVAEFVEDGIGKCSLCINSGFEDDCDTPCCETNRKDKKNGHWELV